MAKIADIHNIESKNQNSIHLFKEGIFWRAYNKSAYLFDKQVKGGYKVTKRAYKGIRQTMLSLAFPDSILGNLFDQEQLTTAQEVGYLCVVCNPIVQSEYDNWFAEQNIYYNQTNNKVTPEVHNQGMGAIINNLMTFSLENATPMECMNFISDIRRQVLEARNNG